MNRETPLLNDEQTRPTEAVLSGALGDSFRWYQDLETTLNRSGITLEWNYYRDGKSWLAKATRKKKTVFWLSACNGFFKVTFYFTAPADAAIQESALSDATKSGYADRPPVGKLKPLTLEVRGPEALAEIGILIVLKK